MKPRPFAAEIFKTYFTINCIFNTIDSFFVNSWLHKYLRWDLLNFHYSNNNASSPILHLVELFPALNIGLCPQISGILRHLESVFRRLLIRMICHASNPFQPSCRHRLSGWSLLKCHDILPAWIYFCTLQFRVWLLLCSYFRNCTVRLKTKCSFCLSYVHLCQSSLPMRSAMLYVRSNDHWHTSFVHFKFILVLVLCQPYQGVLGIKDGPDISVSKLVLSYFRSLFCLVSCSVCDVIRRNLLEDNARRENWWMSIWRIGE